MQGAYKRSKYIHKQNVKKICSVISCIILMERLCIKISNSQRNLKRTLDMRQPVDKCIFVSDRNVSGPVLQRLVPGP